MNTDFCGKEKKSIFDELRQTLAYNLKRARKERGMTMAELGNLTGLSAGQIARLERGTTLNIGLDALAALADGLGLDLRHLLTPTEEER